MIELYLCINRNARPNHNRLITYHEYVSYLQRIHTISCTYNKAYLDRDRLVKICKRFLENFLYYRHPSVLLLFVKIRIFYSFFDFSVLELLDKNLQKKY